MAELANKGIWRWPESSPARGRLSEMEEMDIANAPRPEKSDEQMADERAVREAQADPAAPPDRVPMAITVRDHGVLRFDEGWLKQVSGEFPLSEQDKRMRTVLDLLERAEPVLYHLVQARWEYKRSDRDIATSLGLDHKTVAAMIARAEQRALADYNDLFPQTT